MKWEFPFRKTGCSALTGCECGNECPQQYWKVFHWAQRLVVLPNNEIINPFFPWWHLSSFAYCNKWDSWKWLALDNTGRWFVFIWSTFQNHGHKWLGHLWICRHWWIDGLVLALWPQEGHFDSPQVSTHFSTISSDIASLINSTGHRCLVF